MRAGAPYQIVAVGLPSRMASVICFTLFEHFDLSLRVNLAEILDMVFGEIWSPVCSFLKHFSAVRIPSKSQCESKECQSVFTRLKDISFLWLEMSFPNF